MTPIHILCCFFGSEVFDVWGTSNNALFPYCCSSNLITEWVQVNYSSIRASKCWVVSGTDISPTADFYPKEKSNGKRSASEFDEDDFGPETDVDAVDDALSPVETAKGFGDVFSNNNPAEGVCNPFIEHQEKAALEIERELQKQQSAEAEEPRLAREETPTPPADAGKCCFGVFGMMMNLV